MRGGNRKHILRWARPCHIGKRGRDIRKPLSMRIRSLLLLAGLATLPAAALAAAGPAVAAVAVAGPPVAVVPSRTPGETLRALFAASDEASLNRNPIGRVFRGDLSHAGEFGDGISDRWYAAEKQAVIDDLAALAAIDRKDRKSTRLNSSHPSISRMPSSA